MERKKDRKKETNKPLNTVKRIVFLLQYTATLVTGLLDVVNNKSREDLSKPDVGVSLVTSVITLSTSIKQDNIKKETMVTMDLH